MRKMWKASGTWGSCGVPQKLKCGLAILQQPGPGVGRRIKPRVALHIELVVQLEAFSRRKLTAWPRNLRSGDQPAPQPPCVIEEARQWNLGASRHRVFGNCRRLGAG